MACRFEPDPYSRETRNIAQQNGRKLDNLASLILDAEILRKVNTIDEKMGPQLNGGIGGVLRNFSRSVLVQNTLNMMTWLNTMHNALILSNNLRYTLFGAFDLIYQIPGFEKFAPVDPEDPDHILDYNSWVNEVVDEWVRSIFGDQTVDSVRREWLKASTIYRAATNLLFSLQSLIFTVMELTEIASRYIAWIGNALKKFGVVGDRAYPWMNPNLSGRKVNSFFTALETATEGAEAVEQVAANTLEVTEIVQQIDQQTETLDRALRGLDSQGTPINPNGTEYPHTENLASPQNIDESEEEIRELSRDLTQVIDSSDENYQPPPED